MWQMWLDVANVADVANVVDVAIVEQSRCAYTYFGKIKNARCDIGFVFVLLESLVL